MSRFESRSAMSRRLSWSCLPRASPSSILALPRVMYRRSGTIVWPLAFARPSSSSICSRWSSSLRVRLGSWLYAIALLERRDVGADEPRLALLDASVGVGDVGLAGADRLDLRAGQHEPGLERVVDRELVAGFSVEGDGRIVAHGGSCRAWLEGIWPSARTPVLFGPAFELLTHPQGVRLDGHLLRGGAATRTVDHCTSPPFVPGNRTRTRDASASVANAAPFRAVRRPRGCRPGAGPPSTSSARSSVGSSPGASVRRDARRRPPARARRRGSSACRASASGRS